MPTVQIGERVSSPAPLGRDRVTGEYALHIQCAWAIVIAGTRHESATDVDGARAALAAAITTEPLVVGAEEAHGTLRLRLDHDTVVEIAPSSCAHGEEAWRLFEPGTTAPHLVCYAGVGIRHE